MRTPESDTSKRVRVLLAEHDISAAALARRLGWQQSYISRRLSGRVPWRAADLSAIADELGAEVSALISPSSASAA